MFCFFSKVFLFCSTGCVPCYVPGDVFVRVFVPVIFLFFFLGDVFPCFLPGMCFRVLFSGCFSHAFDLGELFFALLFRFCPCFSFLFFPSSLGSCCTIVGSHTLQLLRHHFSFYVSHERVLAKLTCFLRLAQEMIMACHEMLTW